MSIDKKTSDSYLELRKKTDDNVKKLLDVHGKNIVCKPKCSSCCVNLTVFPVEFESIKSEMKKDGFEIKSVIFDKEATCGFLKDELCQIYKYRPLICRTHGIPISFQNDDDPAEPYIAVSFCDLNFDDVDMDEDNEDDDYEGICFDDNNTLNIDELNENLFRLNQKISKEPTKRIELKDLII